MEKIIVTLVIMLLCIILIGAEKRFSGKDLLGPLSFFALYFLLTRIPRMLLAKNNLYAKELITKEMLWKYLLVTSVFLLAVLIGGFFKWCSKTTINGAIWRRRGYDKKSEKREIYLDVLYRVGLICFGIGALSRIYLIIRAGGIRYIWSHLSDRVSMMAGSGYIDYLSLCMTFGLAAIEICYLRNAKKYKFSFWTTLIVGVLLSLAFGARTPMMRMVIALLFVAWYCSPQKIDLKKYIKLKYILVIVGIVLVLLVLPTFRVARFNVTAESFFAAIKEASKDLLSIFDHISYYDEDVYTFDYFTSHEHWLGGNYKNLLTAWIPRSLYPEKPPIDDGMYLRALLKGYDVSPTLSVVELDQITVSSSIPFTTNGIMFANFGMIGSVIGGFLTGQILVGQYKKMRKREFALEEVLMYQFLCTRLNFSTKGIVEFIMTIIVIRVICGFVYRYSDVERVKRSK